MALRRPVSADTDHRPEAHPGLPSLPSWAAIVIAVTASLAGVLLDAGDKELTNTFAVFYLVGCLGAVLAVEQAGVFTAVTQPPLILFVIVPAAYWWFHGVSFAGLKAILINCGYPLIERFPLMLFTSAVVLLVGLLRWYRAMAPQPQRGSARTAQSSALSSLLTNLHTRIATLRRNADVHRNDGEQVSARPRRARAARSTGYAPARRRGATGRRGTAADRRRAAVEDRRERARSRDTGTRRSIRVRAGEPAATDYATGRRGHQPQPDVAHNPERVAQRGARPDPRLDTAGRAHTPSPIERHSNSAPAVANAVGEGPSATHHPISKVRYRRPNPQR